MRHKPERIGFYTIPFHLRAATRTAALIGGTLFLSILQFCVLKLRLPGGQAILRVWHKLCWRLLALDVRPHGAPADGPVLFVCNHASYLDVTVLGGLMDARYVAKAEVSRWPVIGALSKLQGTIFIERRAQGARSQTETLTRALRSGQRLVLFPEGTSSDGNRVLPFKSALFAAAAAEVDGVEVQVQPMTIAYSRHRGVPMGRLLRPYFAWYGDMTLVGHLWTCLGLGGAGVDVVFHEPVRLSQFGSRKALARYCEMQVAHGLSDSLSGRLDGVPAPAAIDGNGGRVLPGWPVSAVLETAHEM